MAKKEGHVHGILAHEMVHMFDYCRHKMDFKNVQHLACTEIRAANLTNCSFVSAMLQGDASPMKIKQAHRVSSYLKRCKCLLFTQMHILGLCKDQSDRLSQSSAEYDRRESCRSGGQRVF